MIPNPNQQRVAPHPLTTSFARDMILERGRHLASPLTVERHVTQLSEILEEVLRAYFQQNKVENRTYVTVNLSTIAGLYNVAVMIFDAHHDEYKVQRVSPRMRRPEADALARSWAAAGGWDIR